MIADSVNPLPATRDAWVEVANRARVPAVEIEVTCSDIAEHRRRAETRIADISGHRLPTWQDVVSRDYRPWDRNHIAIDTARTSVEQNVTIIRATLSL